MRLIDADALKEQLDEVLDWDIIMDNIDKAPTIDAIPVWWLNERHRKCYEDADTDLMDAITVLCNEYHVWKRKKQEIRGK